MKYLLTSPLCYFSLQMVNEAEKKLHGTLSDGKKIKIFHANGGDIIVEAIEISEGWQLINQNIQVSKLISLAFWKVN